MEGCFGSFRYEETVGYEGTVGYDGTDRYVGTFRYVGRFRYDNVVYYYKTMINYIIFEWLVITDTKRQLNIQT